MGLSVTRHDFDLRHAPEWQREVVTLVAPYTATDGPAIVALLDAIDYVERNAIPGAVVECGVFRGGSVMAAAAGLLRHSPVPKREIWLYDTFEGMTEPEAEDIRVRDGLVARDVYDREKDLPTTDQSEWYWVRAGLEAVRTNVSMTGYPEGLLHYVVGRVEESIPSQVPESIALLRLDTDWYASTKHELEHLLPRLSPGGVLVVDDYHYWQGARKAVDEYFSNLGGRQPLWTRISSSGAVLTVLG